MYFRVTGGWHFFCAFCLVLSSPPFISSNTGKSLIKYVLLRIEEFLYQENLTVEWASFPQGMHFLFMLRIVCIVVYAYDELV